jgi:hypothetical protein
MAKTRIGDKSLCVSTVNPLLVIDYSDGSTTIEKSKWSEMANVKKMFINQQEKFTDKFPLRAYMRILSKASNTTCYRVKENK